jgi:hypothetical protein
VPSFSNCQSQVLTESVAALSNNYPATQVCRQP